MGRGSAISGNVDRPPTGAAGRTERPRPAPVEPSRDPWTPGGGRELLAGVAVIAVLFAILVVYTQDVPRAPRRATAEPVPWAQRGAPSAPADWSAVPVTPLSSIDPALAKAVGAEVLRSRSAIARCLIDAGADADALGGDDDAVVVRLAPRSAALHVDGVEAIAPTTPPELVECARRVLDGDAIPAQGVVPGRRYRVRLALP